MNLKNKNKDYSELESRYNMLQDENNKFKAKFEGLKSFFT